ncbi:MAG: DUF445 family protein [Deltaproteobacteria bacterium]|nr:DUF445 family protein [Deltaproteobacteria bacterium]
METEETTTAPPPRRPLLPDPFGLISTARRVLPLPSAPDIGWLDAHKGTISLVASLAVYLSSYAIGEPYAWWVQRIGEAALIGSFVDFIAIQMLFRRMWFLPGSGVIPRNRIRIVEGLARAVEEEWLTADVIKSKLSGIDLGDLLGKALEHLRDNDETLEEILKQIAVGAASWIDSKEFLDFLSSQVKNRVGRVGQVAHAVGIIDTEVMASDIARTLLEQVKGLPTNENVRKRIQEELGRSADEVRTDEELKARFDRIKIQIVDYLLVSMEGRIHDMVLENLIRFTDDDIREMFETKTKSHLEWIRVNGAIFGGLFGAVFAAIHKYW